MSPASGSDSDEAQQGKQSGVDSDSSVAAAPEPQRARLQGATADSNSIQDPDVALKDKDDGKEDRQASHDSRTQANSEADEVKRDGIKSKQGESNESEDKRNTSMHLKDDKPALSRLPLTPPAVPPPTRRCGSFCRA